jgi:hypothetical protein
MQNRYRIYLMKDTIQRLLTSHISDLVTRESGKIIREAIESRLKVEPDGTVVILDFAGVGPIDYPYADEIIAKLIVRLNTLEYGDKFVAVSGLTTIQEENIHVALERKKHPLLSVPMFRGKRGEERNGWHILGILNPYLKDVLYIVMQRRVLSARELANLRNIRINSASTKLLNLYKMRLATRVVQNLPDRGRQYVYRALV